MRFHYDSYIIQGDTILLLLLYECWNILIDCVLIIAYKVRSNDIIMDVRR